MDMNRRMAGHRLLLLAGIACIAQPGITLAQDEGTVLETIEVESESDDILVQEGYVAKTDRTGTKVDTPLIKVPQAISTVTQDQIEDQKPRTLNEALAYTAGANPNTFGYDSRYDAYYLRGFPAYYNGMFRDGLRQFNGPSAWLRGEPYGLEGVTVLKGPASALYGVSGPGGIVNMVTKRPTAETFREVELTVGQDNRYQAGVDLSGPASAENDWLLYRLTALGRKSDTHLEGYPDDKYYIAPAFTITPDEDTKLTILGEYSRALTGGTAAFYQPVYGTLTRTYGGDPNWNDFDQKQARIGYELEHRLNETVTLRQNLRYADVDASLEYSGLYGSSPTRYWGYYQERVKNLALDNSAKFEFDTGALTHTAVAGLDYNWSDYEAYSGVSYTTLADLNATATPFSGSQRMNMVGVYLHDQIDWDALSLFASARYDWSSTDAVDSTFTATEQTDHGFSGRIGLSYRTEAGITPYATYSTSFNPNVGFVYDDPSSTVNRVADPTNGRQKEIGVKYELPDANAVLTAALFDIEMKNGIVFDTSAGVNKQVQRDLRSRGLELEANASLGNGFSLIAAYTYQHMEIDRGATDTVGNELSATPNHIASLWGHYLVEDGSLAGLGVGAGLRYIGESYGDDQNSFENSARLLVDAAVSYDFGYSNPDLKGLSLQVNAKNLFNTEKAICSAGYCYWDEGRTVYGSLRYRF